MLIILMDAPPCRVPPRFKVTSCAGKDTTVLSCVFSSTCKCTKCSNADSFIVSVVSSVSKVVKRLRALFFEPIDAPMAAVWRHILHQPRQGFTHAGIQLPRRIDHQHATASHASTLALRFADQ